MSAEFSTYGANTVLDALPATLYLKAHLGNPGAAGTANAAAETTRVPVTFPAAAAGAISNDALVQWNGVSTAETWSHWSAWDASSGGNCWLVGTFTTPVVVTVGGIVEAQIGEVDLAMTVWS